MIDYDTTTTAVDNRLRRYRQINLCSDDRASIVSLNLLVAEPMSSKRTSWLRLFFACFECLWCMMLDIFPPQFGFEEALLREKSTEKARCICHTRHSTCSHVDLVVLGVSQHSSLSVLFSVAPPNKCRFGHGKRRVTFHQWLFPCIFCAWVFTKLRNISMRPSTLYLWLSFVKSICLLSSNSARFCYLFKNDEKSRKQAGHRDNTYNLRIQIE